LSEEKKVRAVRYAMFALMSLACNAPCRTAIIEAGAVSPLTALLVPGAAEPDAADRAAFVIARLVSSSQAASSVIAALCRHRVPADVPRCADGEDFQTIRQVLHAFAEPRLRTAMLTTDRSQIQSALNDAKTVGLAAAPIQQAQARLDELEAAARRARRESVGLGNVVTPFEFKCPLTLCGHGSTPTAATPLFRTDA